MRKLLLAGVAAGLGLWAASASADVTVTAVITKDKDITVTEEITKFKDVDIEADVILFVNKAAEVDSLINQSNFDNEACENCAEKLDWIKNSVNNNTGVVSVNQAAGNNNNQANALSAAVDNEELPIPPDDVPEVPEEPGTPGGFAEAQAAVDQVNGLKKETTVVRNPDTGELISVTVVRTPLPNIVDSVNIVFREARIQNSINNNLGVVGVNQATGNMANQANNVGLAIALSVGVALVEADLGQENANNDVHERDVLKTALLLDSVNGNQGIVGVNQSSGNMANQANVAGLSAAIAVQGGI